MRRFYTKQHRFYCGIDLHARLLAICIVDHETASARAPLSPRPRRQHPARHRVGGGRGGRTQTASVARRNDSSVVSSSPHPQPLSPARVVADASEAAPQAAQ